MNNKTETRGTVKFNVLNMLAKLECFSNNMALVSVPREAKFDRWMFKRVFKDWALMWVESMTSDHTITGTETAILYHHTHNIAFSLGLAGSVSLLTDSVTNA